MTTNYFNESQALYLGLFDKVANSSGQAYWEGAMQTNLNGALASLSTYAPITATNTATHEVTNIYENLLGYTSANIGLQSNGVAYWAGLVSAGTMNIAQVVNSIYNIVENISSTSPLYINTETMNARIYAANSFTADYAANVISPANLSYSAAGNYVTTNSGLTQSSIASNPMAPYLAYSPAGVQSSIQSAMAPTTSAIQSFEMTPTVTSYIAQPTSNASSVYFIANDMNTSVIVNGTTYQGFDSYDTANANGTPSTAPSHPSTISSADSLDAAGGNGVFELYALVTIPGADPSLNNSSIWGHNYFAMFPSIMTGIQTIEIFNNSMAINTTTPGGAGNVQNIIVDNAVSDGFKQVSVPGIAFTDPYMITQSQNFTFENTTWGAIIDSTGVSANIIIDNVVLPAAPVLINGMPETQTINLNGATMSTLNLTSTGTIANDISLTTYGDIKFANGVLLAAPLTVLNISGDSANTLTIADNTTSGIANINASNDAGTLNLTTNANIINTTITVGSGVDTITTLAIYDTMNTLTNVNTTPQNFITIAGAINAIASDFISFAGTPTVNSFSAAAATTGYNASNSVNANVTDIISALQAADKGITTDNAVYFYEGGNTYIVNDSNAFTGGANIHTDQVVQLTGTVSLAATSVAAGTVHI